jgi:hypothetical protein
MPVEEPSQELIPQVFCQGSQPVEEPSQELIPPSISAGPEKNRFALLDGLSESDNEDQQQQRREKELEEKDEDEEEDDLDLLLPTSIAQATKPRGLSRLKRRTSGVSETPGDSDGDARMSSPEEREKGEEDEPRGASKRRAQALVRIHSDLLIILPAFVSRNFLEGPTLRLTVHRRFTGLRLRGGAGGGGEGRARTGSRGNDEARSRQRSC